MSGSTRRDLPVVRWLQAGAVAAGLGMALAVAPAVAWADDDMVSSTADSVGKPAAQSGTSGAARRSTIRNSATKAAGESTRPEPARARRTAGPARISAQTNVTRDSDPIDLTPVQVPAPSASTVAAASAATQSPAAAAPAQPKASATATTASSAPGLGYVASRVRLNLEDLSSGTGRPTVTNPTAVVTGMFHEILRRDPTAAELEDYLNRLTRWGVNGVVAGLYNSQAFRQNAVNNYYLELLSRTPTSVELSRGVFRLTLGSEPAFAAFIAGGQEYYTASAQGGGQFGTQPSDTTYVNLLYRSLLGKATDPTNAAILVQQLQGGEPIARVAEQFVNADPYRTVKVGEVYQVLGQTASPTEIAAYVASWSRSGGQAGISQSLLATDANVKNIEAGLVKLPDMAAVADLQKLLLSLYNDTPEGFTKLFNQLLTVDPLNPIGADNPCSATNQSCNTALFKLVTEGGLTRGIPNSSLTPASINADVSTLTPTQNEIDLSSSLIFPLQNAATLKTYFAGGLIGPTGRVPNPIVTADDGAYIVDGHHRWSSVYLINPFTQIVAVDVGYVPNPQTALKEAQMGVIAAKGYLKSTGTEGENIYTINEPLFRQRVREYIEGGKDPASIAEVLKVFGDYLMYDPATTPLDEQYAKIQDYLWANVQRMRALNPYIPGAPSRSVMPQTDPSPIWQNFMGSGKLSYSFPTISYLG